MTASVTAGWGGGVESLGPFVVEPAGGFAHTMSKPRGGVWMQKTTVLREEPRF
jgi:hypothetical protein